MITDSQTNIIYFSPALENVCPILWENIHSALMKRKIRHGLLPTNPQYIWCRDYMPIQIDEHNFVCYNFKPDYLLKYEKRYRFALNCDGYTISKEMNYPTVRMDLIIDGGNVVKCGDIIVMTDKVFVENKTKSRTEIERILHEKLQCDILFLPWDIEEYCGHSDGIVHYAGDGRVMVSSYYYDFFPGFANDIERKLKKRFEVIPFHFKTKRKHKFNWAYVNFLQMDRLIMVPQLGYEDEDGQAIEQIKAVFPDYEVIGILAIETVRKGGALKCISWNIKGL